MAGRWPLIATRRPRATVGAALSAGARAGGQGGGPGQDGQDGPPPKGRRRARGGLLAPRRRGSGKAVGRQGGGRPIRPGRPRRARSAGAGDVSLHVQDPRRRPGTPLSAIYLSVAAADPARPSRWSSSTSRDRSVKDFSDKIADFGNQGLAEGLQKLGYTASWPSTSAATGPIPASRLSAQDWQMMVADLPVGLPLPDRPRHNRGELNLARFRVVGCWARGPTCCRDLGRAARGGDGSLAAGPGRGDLAGVVLISPMVDASRGQGLRIGHRRCGPWRLRVPLCVLCGEPRLRPRSRVKAARPAIVRVRSNKVEASSASSLHGFKLLEARAERHRGDSPGFLDDASRPRPRSGSRGTTWPPWSRTATSRPSSTPRPRPRSPSPRPTEAKWSRTRDRMRRGRGTKPVRAPQLPIRTGPSTAASHSDGPARRPPRDGPVSMW